MKFLILAGGSGTRLWPVSRQNTPKQAQAFFDSATLLVRTFNRLTKFSPKKDIFVATSAKQVELVKKELPQLSQGQIFIEPVARGTLAAIGLSAVRLYKKYPKEVVATINSDHYIGEEQEYARMLKQAEKVVKRFPETITLLGVRPSYPETGYGYIKMGEQVWKIKNRQKTDEVFLVEKFVEKPNLAKAKKYVKRWEYLWNPAYFVFYPKTLLKLYAEHIPKAGKVFSNISKVLGKPVELKIITKQLKKLPAISIDYGLLEKMNNLLVLPADFAWTDVGHWRTIYDILAKNSRANISKGTYLGVKSSGNLVYSLSGKLIATVGVNNFIIIETEDALLVCPKKYSQQVKEIVAKLKQNKRKDLL
ncbi:MAG: sugar phosphate nucleotidyltransferase [Patescibacteria group bacterium]